MAVEALNVYVALINRVLKLDRFGKLLWEKKLPVSSLILKQDKIFISHPSSSSLLASKNEATIWQVAQGGTLACDLAEKWIVANTLMKDVHSSSWDMVLLALDAQGKILWKTLLDRGDQDFPMALACVAAYKKILLTGPTVSRPWPFRLRRDDSLLAAFSENGTKTHQFVEAGWSDPHALILFTPPFEKPWIGLATLGGGLAIYKDVF